MGFGEGLEPYGFRNIPWGTDISVLDGMEHYRTDPSHGGIEFYVRKGDRLTLGEAELKTIQYGFWKSKFYVGMITAQGPSNWIALKKSVFGEFGEGGKPFHNYEEYLWVGKDALMALRYDPDWKIGTFYVRSDLMKQQMAWEE